MVISPTQASGSGLIGKYILLRDGTPAPMWVCSGKQLFSFSHLGISYALGIGAPGSPMLPWT